jgi:hypothetical protein
MDTTSQIDQPTPAQILKITVDVPLEKQAEFNRLWMQIVSGEDNPVSRSIAAEDRNRERVATEGVAALKRLYVIALRDTGQSKVVASFLAGLYNGSRFPFDLTDLRRLDHAIFEDCMALLRMDARQCEQEVHMYFENGGVKWEQMIADWGLGKQHGVSSQS